MHPAEKEKGKLLGEMLQTKSMTLHKRMGEEKAGDGHTRKEQNDQNYTNTSNSEPGSKTNLEGG